MKRVLLLLVLLATTGFADTIKIGVILPLTGNSAHLGERFQKAIEVFKQEKHDFKNNYEFIIEDDQFINTQTALAAQKLINADHVNAIVTWAAGAGNVVAPLAQEKKILHLNISMDPKVAKGIYNFTNWVNPKLQAATIIGLLKTKGAKRIAIPTVRQQAAMLIAKEIETQGLAAGMEAKILYFNPSERDFRTMLIGVRDFKPDFVIPGAFSPEMEILIRQCREMGITAPLTTVGCFDFMSDYSLVEGCWYVSCMSPAGEWNIKFEKLYGKKAVFAEPYLYNNLEIITQAYEHAGVDNLKAAEWISQIKDYPSIIGPLNIDPEGIILSGTGLYKIINQQRTPITTDDIK